MAPPNLKVFDLLTKQNLSTPRTSIADLNYFGTLTLSKEAHIQNLVDSIPGNVDAASSTPCLLLDKLPQELRDMIWEHVVVEPKLCDKRHVPVCAFYNRSGTCQTPPIETQYQKRNPPECNTKEVKECQRLCLRRKGLGLLGTNKQIRREARDIFWKKNTFCLRNDLDGLTSVVNCSLDLSRVQNLMLWNMDPETMPHPIEGQLEGENSLFYKVLERLPGLERLEMQGEVLRGYADVEHLLQLLPNLKLLDLWQFQPVKLESTGETFYIGVHQDFARYHREADVLAHPQLKIMHQQMRGQIDGSLAMKVGFECMKNRLYREYHGLHGVENRPWASATASKLEKNELSRGSDGPEILTVSAPGTKLLRLTGHLDHQVSIWGLPTHTQVWLAEEAKQAAEEEEKAAQAARERLNAWGTANACKKAELGKGCIDRKSASMWLNAGVTPAESKGERSRTSKNRPADVSRDVKDLKIDAVKVKREAPSDTANIQKQAAAMPRPKGRWYRKVSSEEFASW